VGEGCVRIYVDGAGGVVVGVRFNEELFNRGENMRYFCRIDMDEECGHELCIYVEELGIKCCMISSRVSHYIAFFRQSKYRARHFTGFLCQIALSMYSQP
jgi:hypothetical protein